MSRFFRYFHLDNKYIENLLVAIDIFKKVRFIISHLKLVPANIVLK